MRNTFTYRNVCRKWQFLQTKLRNKVLFLLIFCITIIVYFLLYQCKKLVISVYLPYFRITQLKFPLEMHTYNFGGCDGNPPIRTAAQDRATRRAFALESFFDGVKVDRLHCCLQRSRGGAASRARQLRSAVGYDHRPATVALSLRPA